MSENRSSKELLGWASGRSWDGRAGHVAGSPRSATYVRPDGHAQRRASYPCSDALRNA